MALSGFRLVSGEKEESLSAWFFRQVLGFGLKARGTANVQNNTVILTSSAGLCMTHTMDR